jgi:hypothetical protein
MDLGEVKATLTADTADWQKAMKEAQGNLLAIVTGSVALGKTRKCKNGTASGASHRTATLWAQWG